MLLREKVPYKLQLIGSPRYTYTICRKWISLRSIVQNYWNYDVEQFL